MRMNRHLYAVVILATILVAMMSHKAVAESQNEDYQGITDPFGDPSQYEFAEDEKEDKEFFHLGRFLMFGIDVGVGLFTGGLGSTNTPAFYAGAHFIYFFDRSFALEIAGHFGSDVDTPKSSSGNGGTINTTLIPITLGFRYYFNTADAPRAVAIANPYLGLGAGIYLRSQEPSSASSYNEPSSTTSSFGAYGAGGIEFLIYRKHIYLGIDARYHLVFFAPDLTTSVNGGPTAIPGSRSGNYFTTTASITYNF